MLERQPQQRQPIRRERRTAAVDFAEGRGVALAGGGECVRHVGAEIAGEFPVLAKAVLQPVGAFVNRLVFHLHARRFGLRQSGDDIRGHERMALVGLPPAPAAIFVLEIVQAVEARADLFLHGRFIRIHLEAQLADRLADDDVGQKAGHGLLDAAVRISNEVLERAEQRAGNGRRDAHGERSRAGRNISREGEIECRGAAGRKRAAPRFRQLYAGNIHREVER